VICSAHLQTIDCQCLQQCLFTFNSWTYTSV